MKENSMESTNGDGFEEFNAEEFLNHLLFKVIDLGAMAGRIAETELEGREVSLIELRSLAVCAARPGCTAVEISRIIHADPPAISRAVHSLAQKGLLSRRRSRADRREVRLRSTYAGLALLNECQRILELVATELLRSLSEGRRASLGNAVDALLDADS